MHGLDYSAFTDSHCRRTSDFDFVVIFKGCFELVERVNLMRSRRHGKGQGR